jgi:hypothetical protein
MTKNLWEEEYTPWDTKAKYLNWIRGGLRKLWSRHPVKTELKKQNRKKKKNDKGRLVWHNQCNRCSGWFVTKDVQVDHLKPNPPFTELTDIGDYAINLLDVAIDDVQLLCKECHSLKTYAERYGVSMEEAKKRKAEIKRKKEGK